MHLRPLGHATAGEGYRKPDAGRIRRRRLSRPMWAADRGTDRCHVGEHAVARVARPRRPARPGPRTPPRPRAATIPTSARTVLMVPVLLTSVMPRSGSAWASGSRPNAEATIDRSALAATQRSTRKLTDRRDDVAAMQPGHQVGQLAARPAESVRGSSESAIVADPVEQRRAHEAQRPESAT